MKKTVFCIFVSVVTTLVTSCGSFGEGLLAGLGGMGGGYGYGYMTPRTGGNMDYLLDPNYTVAQTMARQQQYNQVYNSLARQTVDKVLTEEEQEYQQFCKAFKKPDGSQYTKDEWRALKGQAIQNMKNGGNTNSSSGRSGTVTQQSSSSKSCSMCRGTKKCWTCSGNRSYINPLTNKRVSCPNCTNGNCPKCNGTGKN